MATRSVGAEKLAKSGPTRPGLLQAPQDISLKGWKKISLRICDQIGIDRVLVVAPGATLYGLLSLFPVTAAFVWLYGFIAGLALSLAVSRSFDFAEGAA
jgi:uncharacterized BrkB/YihY/UPF0761 family membrane protein